MYDGSNASQKFQGRNIQAVTNVQAPEALSIELNCLKFLTGGRNMLCLFDTC
jgi:hypothetical protein